MNHCIEINCPKCGEEYCLRCHFGKCPSCGADYETDCEAKDFGYYSEDLMKRVGWRREYFVVIDDLGE